MIKLQRSLLTLNVFLLLANIYWTYSNWNVNKKILASNIKVIETPKLKDDFYIICRDYQVHEPSIVNDSLFVANGIETMLKDANMVQINIYGKVHVVHKFNNDNNKFMYDILRASIRTVSMRYTLKQFNKKVKKDPQAFIKEISDCYKSTNSFSDIKTQLFLYSILESKSTLIFNNNKYVRTITRTN